MASAPAPTAWCVHDLRRPAAVTSAGHDSPALACPIGDRRTEDRLTDAKRAHNRCQAGLRALLEQSMGHLAGAWSLRRSRRLLSRVRAVDRATAALLSLGRWLHRIPA